jgi:hypothetical protein
MLTGRQAPRGSSEHLIIANPFFIFLKNGSGFHLKKQRL